MTPSHILTLAARNLRGHIRRYTFLLIAVSFGFAIITLMTAISDGMLLSLTQTARQHYAGDLFLMGIDGSNGKFNRITDTAAVSEAIKESELQDYYKVKRTIVTSGAILHFAGNVSRQKYLYGVDWNVESADLKNMDFIAGNVPEDSDSQSILVSRPVAEILGIQLGDSLLLELRNVTGQVNTGTLVVGGIFHDPSIFGYYKTYVSRKTLNSLAGLKPDEYSALGLYLPTRKDREDIISSFHNALVSRLPVLPVIYDKDEFKAEVDQKWDGLRYFLVPLSMYISEVDDLLLAMNITSYVVFLMIVLIVLVSVSVTYKLVIYERTREICTLRALGMQKRSIRKLLLVEAVYLFLFSLAVGFLLSGILLGATMLLSFDWIPGFEIFTQEGRLVGDLRLKTIGINATLMLAIIVPSALVPVVKASGLSLTESLNAD